MARAVGFLDLPDELFEALNTSGPLEQSSLAYLIRTCRRLADLYPPVLYGKPTLYSNCQARLLQRSLDQNASLAHGIHQLTFEYVVRECADADATKLLPRLPNLTSLVISCGQPEDDYRDENQQTAEFLDLYWTSSGDGREVREGRKEPPKHCSFTYYGECPWDIENKVFFLTEPKVQSLEFSYCYAADDSHPALFAATRHWNPAITTKGGLKELSLLKCQIEPAAFGQILLFPQALTRLSLVYSRLDHRYGSDRPVKICGMTYFRAIRQHEHTLECLLVLGVGTEDDAETKPCFLSFPRLRRLYTTTAFLGHSELTKEECQRRDWSDVILRHAAEGSIISSRDSTETMRGWRARCPWGDLKAFT